MLSARESRRQVEKEPPGCLGLGLGDGAFSIGDSRLFMFQPSSVSLPATPRTPRAPSQKTQAINVLPRTTTRLGTATGSEAFDVVAAPQWLLSYAPGRDGDLGLALLQVVNRCEQICSLRHSARHVDALEAAQEIRQLHREQTAELKSILDRWIGLQERLFDLERPGADAHSMSGRVKELDEKLAMARKRELLWEAERHQYIEQIRALEEGGAAGALSSLASTAGSVSSGASLSSFFSGGHEARLEAENRALKESLRALRVQLDAVGAQHAELCEQREAVRGRLDENVRLKGLVAALEHDLAEARALADQRAADAARLQARLAAEEEQAAAQREALQQQLVLLQDGATLLRERVGTLEAEAAERAAQAERLRKEIERDTEMLSAMGQDNVKLNAEVAALRSREAMMVEKLADSERELEASRLDLCAARDIAARAQGRLSSAEAEAARLRSAASAPAPDRGGARAEEEARRAAHRGALEARLRPNPEPAPAPAPAPPLTPRGAPAASPLTPRGAAAAAPLTPRGAGEPAAAGPRPEEAADARRPLLPPPRPASGGGSLGPAAGLRARASMPGARSALPAAFRAALENGHSRPPGIPEGSAWAPADVPGPLPAAPSPPPLASPRVAAPSPPPPPLASPTRPLSGALAKVPGAGEGPAGGGQGESAAAIPLLAVLHRSLTPVPASSSRALAPAGSAPSALAREAAPATPAADATHQRAALAAARAGEGQWLAALERAFSLQQAPRPASTLPGGTGAGAANGRHTVSLGALRQTSSVPTSGSRTPGSAGPLGASDLKASLQSLHERLSRTREEWEDSMREIGHLVHSSADR